MCLYIVTHGEIDIPQFDLADRFLQSVLCTLFDTQFVVLDSVYGIFTVQIDISQSIIYLIQIVFILITLRHTCKHLDYLLVVGAGKNFSLTDTGGKFQFVRWIGSGYFVEHFIGHSVLILCGIDLSQQVFHTGTLPLVLFRLDGRLEVGNGIVELLVLHQIIGIYGSILFQVLFRYPVRIQLTQNIFGFIEPFHFRIAAGLPQASLGNHFFVLCIMAGNIRKGGGSLQEVGIIELPLPYQQPAFLQERVVFLLLLESTLLGIISPTGFLGGFRFDGMQFDRFVAFLDGSVERPSGLLLVLRLCTDRVHMDHFRETFLVAGLHPQQGLIERSLPVKVDVIAGVKSMVEPACLGVFLRAARPK